MIREDVIGAHPPRDRVPAAGHEDPCGSLHPDVQGQE